MRRRAMVAQQGGGNVIACSVARISLFAIMILFDRFLQQGVIATLGGVWRGE
jgi:hypothetical protein